MAANQLSKEIKLLAQEQKKSKRNPATKWCSGQNFVFRERIWNSFSRKQSEAGSCNTTSNPKRQKPDAKSYGLISSMIKYLKIVLALVEPQEETPYEAPEKTCEINVVQLQDHDSWYCWFEFVFKKQLRRHNSPSPHCPQKIKQKKLKKTENISKRKKETKNRFYTFVFRNI